MLKRILTFSLAVFVLVSLLALASCRDEACETCADADYDGLCDVCGGGVPLPPEHDGKIVYTVKVVDVDGNPIPDFVVNIKNGDETIAVKITNANGEVSCSESNALTAADVPFTLDIVDPKNSKFSYDKSLAVLADGRESVTVTLYDSVENLPTETIYPSDAGVESVDASIIDDGGYRVDLNEGYNYFIFCPTVRGQYKISVDSDVETSVGYYGGPHFVQSVNLASADGSGDIFMKDGDLYFNIRIFNVGESYYSSSRYVIRIDVTAATTATVTVKCVDTELPMSKEELPWEEYILPQTPETYVPDFTVSGISELTNFDITNSALTAVYNQTDGFYHLGTVDGPVILVKLTVDSPYLASFKTIMETTQLSVYVYGDDDILDKKVNYHTMMQAYIDAVDETLGVYPLTPAIKEALIEVGDAWGWYEGGSSGIFSTLTPGSVVSENAYLFACCYYEEK